ncbi:MULTISPECIES: NAD(P)H-dependent oxidoreductase [Chromobacterium]|uniref:NAD(P)H-dependent oxidoreductase n=1 Tax=Chromobacterium TaxID=535 RepID=UPI0019685D69|nr:MULTISPECIES: NAD(P)H-dependent oxidoreductase [Chromobacterium]
MNRHALIIHAHPDPASLTAQFAALARLTLQQQGCEVMESDLYAMGWKAGADAQDFPDRLNPQRLFLISESQHAYASGRQSADVAAEQQKLLAADLVIMLFPLWWYGLPAYSRVGLTESTLKTCLRSAARWRYGVENVFRMLMYRMYIPLLQPFSPCLALARQIVNRFLRLRLWLPQ